MTPVLAYVALGANLGEAETTVRAAIAALGRLPGTQLVAASSLYRTAPLEVPEPQPDYINAVARLATTLTPHALLDELLALEARFGRVRPYRWAPRALDLDLLLYGDVVLDTPRLTLPHPRLHRRAFVLEPLLELDSFLEAPGLGPLSAWRARLSDQDVERLLPHPA
ncbi:MAG: 2-amino-4-hydroxy-6-hydroxymethyldihydropteridine diphosphokinase [Tepidiphilus sp.]|jgi:2-amino-4-hydroxy-6-hydroxymethyldihydropteridine diphosphokinase|uniref:2-amino-4-hydroxy-6-hydroxymethyldihydropteridine pyrophosphokinase n=1 Tax=Tepidiphilus thermophilus TaxID=876478 RepID=A0A0K6IPT8_9PROT|nr:2-amino-4-hydroxy-6-hydroxymethyldihydropteridine diphosphokinase [Tepidiphilus thermophilus]MBP6998110.1 2-amino-4-hydroxy-6-hydroxymethyldihydropteridine diphosphokinase [Tepidiphilus sp.]CUB05342.1 2-amino-4-hydroxy-6-hydroxymethyldihydropteridinediphosphokinase [Tepidiphilus thermophilus]